MTRSQQVVVVLGLAAVTVLLHQVGHGAMDPPPFLHPHRVVTWWQARGSVLAVFALGRLVLWWAGCGLLVTWLLGALVAGGRSLGLARALERGRLPGARIVATFCLRACRSGRRRNERGHPGFRQRRRPHPGVSWLDGLCDYHFADDAFGRNAGTARSGWIGRRECIQPPSRSPCRGDHRARGRTDRTTVHGKRRDGADPSRRG